MTPLMGEGYVLSAKAWMRDHCMPITKGEAAILVRMLKGERIEEATGYLLSLASGDYPENELTYCRPGGWYIGTSKQSPKVCRSLVRRAYIHTTDRYGADYQTWMLNSDGRKAAEEAMK